MTRPFGGPNTSSQGIWMYLEDFGRRGIHVVYFFQASYANLSESWCFRSTMLRTTWIYLPVFPGPRNPPSQIRAMKPEVFQVFFGGGLQWITWMTLPSYVVIIHFRNHEMRIPPLNNQDSRGLWVDCKV